jgi:hypothetical protein
MVEFAIFDICHNYLPNSQTLALAEKHHIFVLKPFFIGSCHPLPPELSNSRNGHLFNFLERDGHLVKQSSGEWMKWTFPI